MTVSGAPAELPRSRARTTTGYRGRAAPAVTATPRGRVAHDHGPVDRRGWDWPPAAGEALLEQLIGARFMSPRDDRRDRSESRAVVDEPHVVESQDHVEREFVLLDDVDDLGLRPVRGHPRHDLMEHVLLFDDLGEHARACRREIGSILEACHGASMASRAPSGKRVLAAVIG